MSPAAHADPTAIHAVPAQPLDRGFRLLTLREFPAETGPSSFAWIDQRLLRTPERLSRHGLWFANAFRPEVVAWLIGNLGRPSLHDAAGHAYRNPRWPLLAWRRTAQSWADGANTIEWSVDVDFQDDGVWTRFRESWARQLDGAPDAAGA
jgi:hypothetical protein